MKTMSFEYVALIACGIALLGLPLAGCDGDGGGDGQDTSTDTALDEQTDTQMDADEDSVEDAVADTVADTVADVAADGPDPAACDTLTTGLNSGFMVDGEPRSFYLDLPAAADSGGPWAVVFNWHGLGDSASNMRLLMSGLVDNTDMPFILVTPEDTDYAISGLMVIDWDVAQVTEDNSEARLFDEVIYCLDERWGVDFDHIHSMGFSMGGFVTDMLGTIRGEMMASIATYSGAYGCNSANTEGSMLASMVSWPDHDVSSKYTQLFLHGGTDDTYSLFVETLHFNQFAVNDAAFLNARGHDTVICDHGLGHNVPSDMAGDKLVEFFSQHPLGTDPSPYATDGLPEDFADYCAFQGAD